MGKKIKTVLRYFFFAYMDLYILLDFQSIWWCNFIINMDSLCEWKNYVDPDQFKETFFNCKAYEITFPFSIQQSGMDRYLHIRDYQLKYEKSHWLITGLSIQTHSGWQNSLKINAESRDTDWSSQKCFCTYFFSEKMSPKPKVDF